MTAVKYHGGRNYILSIKFQIKTAGCGCQFASSSLRDIPAVVVSSLHLRYATFLRTLSVRFIFITRHSCGRCQFAPPALRDIPADVVSSLHLRYATFLRTLSVRSTCVTRHAAKKMDHAGKIARAARLLHNSVHRWRIFMQSRLATSRSNYSLSRSIAWVGCFLIVGSASSALVVDSTSTAEPNRVCPSGRRSMSADRVRT